MACIPNTRTDTPPILRLYDDILVEVFSNLVCAKDDPEGRHLMDMIHYQSLLYTSQVCASWRKITLISSALWSHAIDLDVLEKKSDSWINEVMSRTKNAPLFIHGSLRRTTTYRDTIKHLSLFMSILREGWSRISILSVTIWSLPLSVLGDVEELCRLLQRPAPELRLFSFFVASNARYFRSELGPFPVSLPRLFHGAAPYLHTYHSNQFWLSPSTRDEYRQLTSLSLPSWLSAGQILKTLENLPFLTHLYLRYCLPYDPNLDTASLPIIILPNLRMIHAEIYDPFMDVLDHIRPFHPCYLNVSCDIGNNIWFMERVNSDTIRHVFKMFLDQDPVSMDIRIHEHSFNIVAYSYDKLINKEIEIFDFYADDGWVELADAVLTWLWSLLASCHDIVRGIRCVTLIDHLGNMDVSSDNPFTRFCQIMVSVERLKIGSWMLRLLVKTNLAWMFPSLKTLDVGSIRWISSEELLQVLNNWTSEPRSDTTSIKTLQLSSVKELRDCDTDLSCLDEKAVGLRVVWGDSQEYAYVCGSGNPTNLDFRAH